MATDGELLARWRRGETDAFGLLYERHRAHVYQYLLSLVCHPEAAEDLLQETFLRVFARSGLRAGSRNGLASARPYLAAVARNLAADWLRRGGREQRALERKGQALLLSATTGEGELSAAEASELIWRLPPEQREAVILRVYFGLEFVEIGRVTGVPLATAASRYRYGIEKIREALESPEASSEPETKL